MTKPADTPPTRKRQPPATPAAAMQVTQPAVAADQVFGNVITAQRDTASVLEQALRSQLTAREGQYERDMIRLQAEFNDDASSLAAQIAHQANIINAADAALDSLKATNVVPMRSPIEVAA